MFEMGSSTSSGEAVETDRILNARRPSAPGRSAARRLGGIACLSLLGPAVALLGNPGGASAAGPPSGAASGKASASADAASRAKEHFDAAQALFDKKKYDAALVLFREAYDETKSPNAHLMVGTTLLRLGRLAEGYDELMATMREAGARAETEPKYAAARDQAAAEIAPLESKIAKLVLTFSGAAPAGAKVTVNGVVIPAAKLGSPIAYLPGSVEIVVEGLGGKPMKSTEALTAGVAKTVVLGPPAPEKTAAPHGSGAPSNSGKTSPSAAPSAAPVTPEGGKSGGTIRTVGYGVAALGVAGMVLFGVSAGVAQSKMDELQKGCGSARCTDPKYADVVDSGKTMDLLSSVGLGAGIVGLAGGAAMIVFGGPRSDPKPTAPASSPAASHPPAASVEVTPSGAMIRVRGSF